MMVEHILHAITAVADDVLVLHHGEVLTHGKPAEVLADQRVIEAYLGSRFAARAAAKAGAAPVVAQAAAPAVETVAEAAPVAELAPVVADAEPVTEVDSVEGSES